MQKSSQFFELSFSGFLATLSHAQSVQKKNKFKKEQVKASDKIQDVLKQFTRYVKTVFKTVLKPDPIL